MMHGAYNIKPLTPFASEMPSANSTDNLQLVTQKKLSLFTDAVYHYIISFYCNVSCKLPGAKEHRSEASELYTSAL
jgi:hypothetical protein